LYFDVSTYNLDVYINLFILNSCYKIFVHLTSSKNISKRNVLLQLYLNKSRLCMDANLRSFSCSDFYIEHTVFTRFLTQSHYFIYELFSFLITVYKFLEASLHLFRFVTKFFRNIRETCYSWNLQVKFEWCMNLEHTCLRAKKFDSGCGIQL
jgi:hypothetical protein